MHKPCPRKPSSLPPFRFFFHHPPQRPVDLPLIPPPHLPEPRQHIRIQIHRHPLLSHPPPLLQLPRPLPPDFPSGARGTPLPPASRSPHSGDLPALRNSFL